MTDIVIVSYKDEQPLKECIASIEKHCIDYKLFIEDNNPPLPNRGFTAAVNAGIKKGTSEWVWLLNSDALVINRESQTALIERFSQSPKVGLVGSMQIDAKPPADRISFGGASCCFPSGRHLGGLVSMGHCQIPAKQTWLNFASVMISRKMIKDIGLLDESLFLIYSDSDYSYMARESGYSAWYEPRSRVYHTLGSSRGGSEWHQKDMETFMKKWGITFIPDKKQFQYSQRFAKLDMFP